MKKFLLALVFLLPCSAFATTTVSGKMQDLGTGNITSGSFMRFWLRGCAGNQPRVNGTSVIGPTQGGVFYFDIAADSGGNISGTLYSTRDSAGTGNGDIECGGSKLAVWYGMQAFVSGRGGPEVPIHAKSGTTLDITQVTPITTNPVIASPTGDTTYLRLDAGNSPVIGNLVVNGSLKCKTFEQVQCVDSSFIRGGSDIGAEINLAYAALPSAGGYIQIAGGSYAFSTPIALSVNGKVVKLVGAGTSGTTLQWTPSSGTALTLDTGVLTGSYSHLEDFSLTTAVGGSTATGLSVGPSNGTKKALIHQINVTGFKLLAVSTSLFNEWDEVSLENCSSAANSAAYTFSTPGDDDRFLGGDLAGCSLLVNNTNPINGPLVFVGTKFFSGSTTTTFLNLIGNSPHIICVACHLVNGAGLGTPDFWEMPGGSQIDLIGGIIENDVISGSTTAWAHSAAGVLNMSHVTITSAGATATQLVTLSGTVAADFFGNNISSGSVGSLWNTSYTGAAVVDTGTNGPAAVEIFEGRTLAPLQLQFTGNATNPVTGTAQFYNQSGVGPTVNGSRFQVRAGATPAVVEDCATTGCTLTTPTITGVANGTGLQLFNSTTTCTTGASIGATCTTAAITLPVAYADTNYRLSCTGLAPTNVPVVETYAKSNTTFTITIAALTAAAATFTSYDCSSTHN